MADFEEKALGWDDEIENDGVPFTVLPEGDYHFGVSAFERGYFNGSAKMPACNMAVLTLAILGPEYPFKKDVLGEVKVNLMLHSKMEWKLCQFFTCIGMRKHGEKLVMNWNAVMGAEGDCHIGTRKWTDKNGKERDGNEVTEFYDPEKSPLKIQQADLFGANPAGSNFTPGQF